MKRDPILWRARRNPRRPHEPRHEFAVACGFAQYIAAAPDVYAIAETSPHMGRPLVPDSAPEAGAGSQKRLHEIIAHRHRATGLPLSGGTGPFHRPDAPSWAFVR